MYTELMIRLCVSKLYEIMHEHIEHGKTGHWETDIWGILRCSLLLYRQLPVRWTEHALPSTYKYLSNKDNIHTNLLCTQHVGSNSSMIVSAPPTPFTSLVLAIVYIRTIYARARYAVSYHTK